LVVPLWRSAPFWPLLTSDGFHLAHFVEDWVDLPPLKTIFCIGRHSSSVFGREDLNFRFLAIRINFRSARFFLMPGFALAIEVGVLFVRLHQFGKLLFFIIIIIIIFFFSLAFLCFNRMSGASGWPLRSQWVDYANFCCIFYSQWVACA